jgi:predicted kinase
VTTLETRRLILITGPPASGKSTLARPLAAALGFALLTKDDIKESLYASFNEHPVDENAARELSRRLSTAATDLLFALAPHCPSVILEANFRTKDPAERAKLATLLRIPNTHAVEVHCHLPLGEAARRFAHRANTERNHPAHALHAISQAQLAESAQPFALTPVIEIDTTQPARISELAAEIRAALSL